MEDLLDDWGKDCPDAEEFRRCLRQIRIQGGALQGDYPQAAELCAQDGPCFPACIQINDVIEETAGISKKRSKANNIRVDTRS